MKLAALKALIEKLASDGYTSVQEKLIALAFAILDEEEIQQCEVVETLKLNEKHCRNTLKSFGEKKIVEVFGTQENMPPEFRERLIAVMTPAERKKFGVRKKPNRTPTSCRSTHLFGVFLHLVRTFSRHGQNHEHVVDQSISFAVPAFPFCPAWTPNCQARQSS